MNQHENTREAVIAQAVNAQKIAADRAEEYRRLYDAQPVAIHNLLTAPVEQGGLMAGMNLGGDPFPELPTEYPKEWLGQQHQPRGIVTVEGGAGGGVAFEDRTTHMEASANALPAPPKPSPAGGSELPGTGGNITIGGD